MCSHGSALGDVEAERIGDGPECHRVVFAGMDKMHDVVDHPEPDLRRLSVAVASSLDWLYVVYRQMLVGRLWMMQCSQ